MYSRTTQNDTFGFFVSSKGLRFMVGKNYNDKVVFNVSLSELLKLRDGFPQIHNGQEITLRGSFNEQGNWIEYNLTISRSGVTYSDSTNTRVYSVIWSENELKILEETLKHIIILVGFRSCFDELSWALQNKQSQYYSQPTQQQSQQVQQPQRAQSIQQPQQPQSFQQSSPLDKLDDIPF